MQRTSERNYAIIVAGGTGTRMQSITPKQFMPIGGVPIMVHTLRQFFNWDAQIKIIVVMHSDFIEQWRAIAQVHCPEVAHQVVPGGRERFDSVKAGLSCIDAAEAVVGIHDAVRPLVSNSTLQRCFEGAKLKGCAVPCVPVTDSIRMVETDGSKHLDRSSLRAIQTPQCFSLQVLKHAYQQPFSPFFTDDASVVESSGYPIHLVEGNRENIKITNPEDLLLATALLDVI
jgi:2-C-methyl-D-erythritol 4-phosphate cytidylyltransferase